MTVTLRRVVPARFYDDHAGRDLPSGREVSRSGSKVTVDLDAEAYADLLADAAHYVSMGTAAFGPGMLGLVSSARATVRALS